MMNSRKENERLEKELGIIKTQQLLDDDMISSDDFFPSSEEELFRQIQEDERENENTVDIFNSSRTLEEKIKSWDDGGCSTGLNEE